MAARVYRSALQGLWLLFFALLPLTSAPFVSRAAGSSSVAPASGAVLLLLAAAWFFPHLVRRGRMPLQALPLMGFACAALLSSAAAFFSPLPPFREFGILRSEIKALVTLLVGVFFFFLTATWTVREERMRFALRVINWSGIVMLLWSFAQAYSWRAVTSYPQWMWTIQEFFTGSRLYEYRVTGLALEPSWLAHQLNLLYLPFWMAATVTGQSAHARKVWKVSLENVLLVLGLAVLYLSLSRVGLLAFLSMIAFYFLVLNQKLIGWAQRRIGAGAQNGRLSIRARKTAVTLVLTLVLLAVYAGLLLGLGYTLSKVDYRMARLFNISTIREASFIRYANQLVIAERLVFWQAGWGVFSRSPLLGVGLGNAGFYFSEELSPYSWALTEVRLVMYHLSALPNIKSLWVRLLAETGLLGFALFLGWCYSLWRSAAFLRASPSGFSRLFGWAGSFVLVGMLIEGFSVDSFALPYFWVSLGLLTGAFAAAVRARPSQ